MVLSLSILISPIGDGNGVAVATFGLVTTMMVEVGRERSLLTLIDFPVPLPMPFIVPLMSVLPTT
jgi:hypothetical protein